MTAAEKITVLFVCIHNSARSPMAEAFLNYLGGGRFIAESAGLTPGELNPLAVEVMNERGIDIVHHEQNDAFDFYKHGKRFNYVITVCDESNAEHCPIFPGFVQRQHWSFKDPSAFDGTYDERLEKTRKVRDEIEAAVKKFIAETGAQ